MRYVVNPGTVDLKAHSDAHSSTPSEGAGVSQTQQHLRDELDINRILARFEVTGAVPLTANKAMYGDFTGIEDWQSAVEKVEKVQEDFMKFPPEVREHFGNSPGGLIEYARSHTYADYLEFEKGRQARLKLLEAEKAEKISVVDAAR